MPGKVETPVNAFSSIKRSVSTINVVAEGSKMVASLFTSAVMFEVTLLKFPVELPPGTVTSIVNTHDSLGFSVPPLIVKNVAPERDNPMPQMSVKFPLE